MKNQYIGDLNDFRKYGLLRTFERAGLRLFVAWMLTENDRRNDGSLRGYLRDPARWRHFDPDLFDGILRLVRSRPAPHVCDVLESAIIRGPHFDRVLYDTAPARSEWFRDLAQRVQVNRPDILFFDPDNGFSVKSVGRGRRSSSKYIFWDELSFAVDAGCSLAVYQHLPRRPRESVVATLLDSAELHYPALGAVCVSAKRVIFVLLLQPEHKGSVLGALEKCAHAWREEISVVAIRG